MSELLSVSSLSKSYKSGDRTLRVLEGLSLTVSKGDMIAVTGESGSGKSTLLHLLGGMEKPDSGEIIFDGTNLSRLGRDELASFRNVKIGFVFQFHHLLPEFSAVENVAFPLLLRRKSLRSAEDRAWALLQEVGLEGRGHHKPGELSGGEQQRVAIARALVGEPALLLADEPTGDLDLRNSNTVHELLLDVHDRFGLTSIIVTHNQQLASLCHQQKSMVDGNLH
ncbi:MAG: ABC transporter ATP-binding protein [bacterium]